MLHLYVCLQGVNNNVQLKGGDYMILQFSTSVSRCCLLVVKVTKLLVQQDKGLLEMQTEDGMSATPLIIASEAGALDAVRTLIELKANGKAVDKSGRDPVRAAAQYSQFSVLKFFTTDEWCLKSMPSWQILADMLSSSVESGQPGWALSAVVALLADNLENWKNVMQAKQVPHLVKLMKNSETQEQAAMAMRLVSVHHQVQEELIAADGVPVLVTLLSSQSQVIQSHADVILGDLLSGDLTRQVGMCLSVGLERLTHPALWLFQIWLDENLGNADYSSVR